MTAEQDVARIVRRLRTEYGPAIDPSDPRRARALTRAGAIISNQAKRNSPIDTGNLRNSISFRVSKGSEGSTILTVGSFGVPYAAYQEFGFKGTVQVRSHNRLVTKAFGRVIAPVNAVVSSHARNVNYSGQPYLIPAFKQTRNRVVNVIRKELFG